MTEIARGVFCIATDYPLVADGPLNVYVIRGEQIALTDAAVPSTYDAVLRDALADIGIAPADLDWLLLTHAHPDHIGGVPALRAAGARLRVAAPLEDVIWAESLERQWHDCWDDHPGALDLSDQREFLLALCGGDLPVDRVLRDGEIIDLGGRRLRVVQTRGHTPGHSAFYDEDQRILFCGDVGFGRGVPASSGTSVFAPMYDDVDDHVTGLERLRALPFELLCPAHIDPLGRDDGLALLDASIAFVDELDTLVAEMIATSPGTITTRAVAQAIGERVGMVPPIAMHTVSTATAHLRRAARRGLIEPTWQRRDG